MIGWTSAVISTFCLLVPKLEVDEDAEELLQSDDVLIRLRGE